MDSSIPNIFHKHESVSTVVQTKYYKLPKLSIKPQDKTLINYLSLWSQFKKINEDSELDNCNKFQYLLQSVQSGNFWKAIP